MRKDFFNAINIIKNKIRKIIYKPNIQIEKNPHLIILGSVYGGWTFEDRPDLSDGWIISCGLGEDASFDAEIANRTGAKIVIVDPTPRAIRHFEQLSERVGSPPLTSYVPGGRQPPESYDLSRVRPGQITLEAEALWVTNTPVRFYRPKEPAHVSHSIIFESGDADDFIIVPTVTINELVNRLNIDNISILKMDIEGAEIEILRSIHSWTIVPKQVLVEFDILRDAGSVSKQKVENIDALLRSLKFRCVHIEGYNYTYVR